MRLMLTMILSVLLALGVSAQESDQPWQTSITGQIEAFRSGDGDAALSFASEVFRETYDDPERFIMDIERLGYGPIVESRSHSFARFETFGPDSAVQIVNFVGPDRSLYEAAYQMTKEGGTDWRVQGVVMRQSQGTST